MKKEKKISIIVPVYNGEKFIDKCFESLINQTYKNIEVIAIDDGSSDKSYDKLKQYSNKYPFIKCYHQTNKGPSITRNNGITYATGSYITVLDVDDWFDHDFLEKMITNNEKYDLIIGGYRRIYESGKIDFEYVLKKSDWNKYRRVTVWAKIYKTSFIKKNKITYPQDRIYGEDVVYTMRCMSKKPTVCFVDYIGYNNLINENSITHKDTNKIKENVPKIFKHCDEFIKENKIFIKENKKTIKYYYLKIVASYLIEQAAFLPYDSLEEYYKDSLKNVKSLFKKYNYKFSLVYQKDEPLKINIIINTIIIFEKLHIAKILLQLLHKVYYKDKT